MPNLVALSQMVLATGNRKSHLVPEGPFPRTGSAQNQQAFKLVPMSIECENFIHICRQRLSYNAHK